MTNNGKETNNQMIVLIGKKEFDCKDGKKSFEDIEKPDGTTHTRSEFYCGSGRPHS